MSGIQDWVDERIKADDIPDELKELGSRTIHNLLNCMKRQASEIEEKNQSLENLRARNNFLEKCVLPAAAYYLSLATPGCAPLELEEIVLPSIAIEYSEFALQEERDLDYWRHLQSAAEILGWKETKKIRHIVKKIERKSGRA